LRGKQTDHLTSPSIDTLALNLFEIHSTESVSFLSVASPSVGGEVGGKKYGFLPHHSMRPASHVVSTSTSHAGGQGSTSSEVTSELYTNKVIFLKKQTLSKLLIKKTNAVCCFKVTFQNN